MGLVVWSGGGIDFRDDAQGSVVVAGETVAFGDAGSAELAEEGFGAFGVLDPDGRWTSWWVACGHRAESHMPVSGRVAVGVPASLRQRARDGSVNQQ